jgi:hypothetical protein
MFIWPRQFGDAGECRPGFFGCKALSELESLTVGRLQIDAPQAVRDRGLDLLHLRQARELRPGLSDLRHLGRRRKALERWR